MLLWVDSMAFFGVVSRGSEWLLMHYYAITRLVS